jgi:hypothetical protein
VRLKIIYYRSKAGISMVIVPCYGTVEPYNSMVIGHRTEGRTGGSERLFINRN